MCIVHDIKINTYIWIYLYVFIALFSLIFGYLAFQEGMQSRLRNHFNLVETQEAIKN